MVAQRLDGKACAASVEEELHARISTLKQAGIIPHLAVLIVGDDPASHVYVGSKVKACERLGIKSTHIELPSDSSENEVRMIINKLNADKSLHGILVQSPLPKHLRLADRVTDSNNHQKKTSMVFIQKTLGEWHWICPPCLALQVV